MFKMSKSKIIVFFFIFFIYSLLYSSHPTDIRSYGKYAPGAKGWIGFKVDENGIPYIRISSSSSAPIYLTYAPHTHTDSEIIRLPAASVLFADATGTIGHDSVNFIWNYNTNTLNLTNITISGNLNFNADSVTGIFLQSNIADSFVKNYESDTFIGTLTIANNGYFNIGNAFTFDESFGAMDVAGSGYIKFNEAGYIYHSSYLRIVDTVGIYMTTPSVTFPDDAVIGTYAGCKMSFDETDDVISFLCDTIIMPSVGYNSAISISRKNNITMYFDAWNMTQGTFMRMGDWSALNPKTLDGALTGIVMDFTTNLTLNNQDIIGLNVTLPTVYGTGVERAAYFSGDGKVVNICNDTYGIETEGDVVIDYGYLHVNPDSVATSSYFTDPGDFVVGGKSSFRQGMSITAGQYSYALLLRNYGDSAKGIYTGCTLTASIQTVYCYTANFISDGIVEGDVFTVASGDSYLQATGEIESVDTTSLILCFGSANLDTINDITAPFVAVVNPTPVFFVTDNGDAHLDIGTSEEASFKIKGNTVNNEHLVHIVATPNVDGISAVDVDINAGTFGAISAYKMSMDLTEASDGNDYTGLDVIVNAEGSTGGDFHAIDIAFAGADWSDTLEIEGLATGIGVNPVKQYLGEILVGADTFWKWTDGTWNDISFACSSDTEDTTLFDNDNDYLYCGMDTVFKTIIISLTVEASATINPTYYVGGVSQGWTEIVPADDSNKFQQSGAIRGISFAGITPDTIFVGSDSIYWFAIRRKRNNMATVPTENTIHIIAPTNEYKWDKNGDLTIRNITCDTLWVEGISMAVPDYVFKPGYTIHTLEYVENYVLENNHLPNFPSAKDTKKINVFEDNMRLREEIEKLYLYKFSNKKRFDMLEDIIFELKKEIELLKKER